MTTLSTAWDQVVPRHIEPVAPLQPTTPRITVGDGGVITIRENSDTRPVDRMSRVPADTFFGRLDDIAKAVIEAQANNGVPRDEASTIYTDRNGAVLLGSDARPTDRLSRVTPDSFYAQMSATAEAEFARDCMPASTLRISDGDVEGWHFTITNEFGDSYDLFMYWHAGYGCYRVALLSPRMDGGIVDAHGTHLWTDGTLCLTHRSGSGYPTMEATYAKAALWTRGASFFRRGHGFQFNTGQSA